MKHTNSYGFDYPTAFLSALDISGLLVFSGPECTTDGINNDMYQLKRDLKILEDDYLKVTVGTNRKFG